MDRQGVLTTQQAAQLLGCSRQHVVDLCDAGRLPCTRIGVHRRIRRVDLEGFVPRPDLRREELRSLWLHRAVAGKVVRDPLGAIAQARWNIERLRQTQPRARAWLDEWASIIDAGPEAVLEMLTSPSRQAVELRQNTPFVGLLSEDEQRAVLAGFGESHRAGRLREYVAVTLGRGVPPSPAALRESAVVPAVVPGAPGVGGGGAVGLAEQKTDTGSPAASGSAPVPSGAGTSIVGSEAGPRPSGGGAPERRAAEAPDPCAVQRRLVEERCEIASQAQARAESVAVSLQEARRAYDDASSYVDAATSAADPRSVQEAKEGARHEFRAARDAATSRADLERAATIWLNAIHEINRTTREAARTVARERRRAADLLASMEKLALDVDAARTTAEVAAEACREARLDLATCEQGGIAPQTAAFLAPAAPEIGDAPAWAVERGGPPAIVRLLQGDREVRAQVVAALAGDEPAAARRYQLLLSDLVDAIAAGAITQAFLDFPLDHAFWGEFERAQNRAIVVGLASLGYRFDGLGGFVDGRVPSQRDLSLAISYAGLDPMRIRRWPDEADMAELFRAVSVGANEYLAAAAPDLAMSDMLSLLGRRSEALADLWNVWGRARDLLLAPVPEAPSAQADHP